MKKYTILFVFIFMASLVFADSSITIRKSIEWKEGPVIHNPTGNFATAIYAFQDATYSNVHPSLPYFSGRHPVSGYGVASVETINARYEVFDKPASQDDIYLAEDLQIYTYVLEDRGQFHVNYFFIPIRKTASGTFERVISFELKINFSERSLAQARDDYTYTSVLSEGDVYKIAVSESGMHKMSYDFLKNDLGLDVDNINPKNLSIYGAGGGMLPESVDAQQIDDLEELAIFVQGEGDDKFNSGDYVLFYAEGPDKWYYDSLTNEFHQPKNVFDKHNYYFVKVTSQNGLRVSNNVAASESSVQYTTTAFDDFQRFEEDRFNLLNEALGAQGSGRDWYGDPFNPTRERNYDDFSFPNIITSEPARINVEFAMRSRTSSTVSVEVAGQVSSVSKGGVNWANVESTYALVAKVSKSFNPTGDDIDVKVTYPGVGDGTNIGWLDYIELNVRRQLIYTGSPLLFRDHKTLDYAKSRFQVSGVNDNTLVWDVSNPIQPKLQEFSLSGSQITFGAVTNESLKEYLAFDPSGSFSTPEAIGKIENQNYHGIDNVDMVIVYHDDFAEAANILADHRATYSGLDVEKVRIDLLYNEFSSGRQDPTAIRDFSKMLYDRNPQKFKYLLLMGDGSFDYKDITGQGKNYIPVYETKTSLSPIQAFPSDDYFALLTIGEGQNLQGALDISVGRIPARTPAEAIGVVEKIIHYDTDPEAMRDWRNRLTYNADDEDSNIHLTQGDRIAQSVRGKHPVFNVNKIFFDAYQQVSTPGGERFPKANEAINRDMFKGVLVLNYMGHGGSSGWAQERVLTLSDINKWKNDDRLPLFVTATCSFAGYDEPSITSAGELALLKDDGGVIALFTTTRAVYSFANDRLTTAVFDTIFQDPAAEVLTIGEILRRAKNSNPSDTLDTNARKFTLLGDPSLKLAIPEFQVVTTIINDHDLSDGLTNDTIQALQTVTIEGLVQDHNGNTLTDFNGTVYPTVFDKEITATTLGQNGGSFPKDFKIQKNLLFKGRAKVTNGAFKFSFVVPKDINYEYGYGKISYYAENGVDKDARGYYDKIIIGGTYPDAEADDQGPLVEVFMNSEDFVFGGITGASPTLFAKLSDDNGINVVGNSIGHDLTGVLDENTQDTYILNDFYESEVDDYTKGEVRFPLFDLEEGVHRIKVKAWDVSNNSGEGYTEFLVTDDAEVALDYVLNYPNPFTTSTSFQFEHNMKDQDLEVQIQIFTIGGILVKTLENRVFTDGQRVSGIQWDGKDDYGGQLARGVYLYKVKVAAEGVKSAESEFEKLVILK